LKSTGRWRRGARTALVTSGWSRPQPLLRDILVDIEVVGMVVTVPLD